MDASNWATLQGMIKEDKLGRRKFEDGYQDIMLKYMKMYNPSFKGNKVKRQRSRKRNSPFFTGLAVRTYTDCKHKMKICIPAEGCTFTFNAWECAI